MPFRLWTERRRYVDGRLGIAADDGEDWGGDD